MRSEPELNKGYANLHLVPLASSHSGASHGYVIECKYLQRRDTLDESAVAAAAAQAADQLKRYLADDALRREPTVHHVGLALVFHGWEMVYWESAA